MSKRPAITPSIKERKQMCSDLGLYYKGISGHGDSLTLLDRLIRAMDLLDRVIAAECRVDVEWYKDYFMLGGQHMILTEEGWEPGEVKADYLRDYEEHPEWGNPIMDEVNAPKTASQAALMRPAVRKPGTHPTKLGAESRN